MFQHFSPQIRIPHPNNTHGNKLWGLYTWFFCQKRQNCLFRGSFLLSRLFYTNYEWKNKSGKTAWRVRESRKNKNMNFNMCPWPDHAVKWFVKLRVVSFVVSFTPETASRFGDGAAPCNRELRSKSKNISGRKRLWPKYGFNLLDLVNIWTGRLPSPAWRINKRGNPSEAFMW